MSGGGGCVGGMGVSGGVESKVGTWETADHECMGLLLEIIQNQRIIEVMSTSAVHANVNRSLWTT